jgi:hypothetical protein
MTTYVLRLNLRTLAEQLSRSLRCRLSSADVRGFLQSAGFVESPLGWLTCDLRPLMLMFARPAGMHAAAS